MVRIHLTRGSRIGVMVPNPYESPVSPSLPESRRSLWSRKPSWVVATIAVLAATYGPICVLMVTVNSLPQDFIGPLTLLYPCQIFTPLVLFAGAYIGRQSVGALTMTAGILLVTTTFTAFVTYSLLDA